MEKHILELNDNRLNADTAPASALHLVVGTESVSVMVADRAGEVLSLQSWQYSSSNKPFAEISKEPNAVLAASGLLQLPFGQEHLAMFHRGVTLVPRRLFQHNALEDYFKLILQPGEYVFGYEEMPEFDANLVFATEKAQIRFLTDLFPKGRVRHLAVPLLRYVRSLSGISEHTVFVNLRHQVAQVIVLERQNLLLYNTYPFSSPADLLYFVLLVYDQFRLSPKEVPLTVAGNILRDSELDRILYRFIREIRFATPPVQFHVSPEAQTLPLHCHLDLFCLKNHV
ncbi:MAG: DUF3822 family protein [Bacteroidetes bacterium]|nr:MAG: DUF3822 family protein [Bacteroidota bacterium]